MGVQNIYNLLRRAGLTHEGTCALMGNMKAESGMKSNIAQRGMTRLSDEEYTSKADRREIEFIHDQVGYGLCQWTYFSRKKGLLDFAQGRGTSIGDETTQVLYAIQELQSDHSSVMNMLKYSNDLYGCTSTVCTKYERPAINNISARYQYAKEFMNLSITDEVQTETEVATVTEVPETFPTYWPPRVVQCGKGFDGPEVALIWALLRCRGYTDKVSDNFTEELVELVKAFQASSGFSGADVDGIVGPMTWAKLLQI